MTRRAKLASSVLFIAGLWLIGACTTVVGDAVSIDPGPQVGCLLNSDGAVECFSAFEEFTQIAGGSTTAVPIPQLSSSVDKVVVGFASACALQDGEVSCWGANYQGQLGNGSNAASSTPAPVIDLPANMVDVSLYQQHVCALGDEGTVWCWGGNDFGQLGTGDTTNSLVAKKVPDLEAEAIATGGASTCAISSGEVVCWGRGALGRLGSGNTADQLEPTLTLLEGSPSELFVGFTHACAKTSVGVECWGQGFSGALGQTATSTNATPIVVDFGFDPVDIGLGHSTSCAVSDLGEAYCMGRNQDGQLGIGHTTDVDTPTLMVGTDVNPATAINAGPSVTCVTAANGQALCTGGIGDGYLGDGTTDGSSVLVNVVR